MLKQIVTGFVMLGCAVLGRPAQVEAQGTVPYVLVMGEDADRDTVPRNSRVFRQVLQEIQGEFNAAGYKYFDETGLGGDYYVPDRTRRPRQELLKVAETMSPPMDVVIIFQIFASTKKYDFMTEASMRVEGEMIDVQTKQGLGHFEVAAGERFKLPVSCSRECLLEEMSKEAKPLGRDLGQALVAQINQRWTVPQGRGPLVAGGAGGEEEAGFVRTYNLCFDDFTQPDMLRVEDYLKVFGGYQSHRVTEARGSRTCYDYETASSQSKLTSNLVRMGEHAGFEAQLTGSGAKFTLTKIPTIARHPLDPKDWN